MFAQTRVTLIYSPFLTTFQGFDTQNLLPQRRQTLTKRIAFNLTLFTDLFVTSFHCQVFKRALSEKKYSLLILPFYKSFSVEALYILHRAKGKACLA